jgi:hypothetical protein
MISPVFCSGMFREGFFSGLFLLATVTALIAVWGLYRD